MARRPEISEERLTFTVTHGSTTADATDKFWIVPAGRSFRVDSAKYINPTGLARDDSNFFEVAVKKGSTTMASLNTGPVAGAGAAIAADTFTALTLSATEANQVAAADDVLSLVLDETGTATLPAGRIVVEGRLL